MCSSVAFKGLASNICATATSTQHADCRKPTKDWVFLLHPEDEVPNLANISTTRTSPLVADSQGCIWAAAGGGNRKVLLTLNCWGRPVAKCARYQADSSVDTVLQRSRCRPLCTGLSPGNCCINELQLCPLLPSWTFIL